MSFGEGFLEAQRRKRIRWTVVGAAFGIALLGGAIAVLALAWRDPPRRKPSVAEAAGGGRKTGPEAEEAEQGLAELGVDVGEACDHAAVRALMKRRREAGDHDAAIRIARLYERVCPVNKLMRWIVHEALESLDRWEEAAALAGELIASEPADDDYWGWRARAYEELARWPEAVHDRRQALALTRLHTRGGDHADGFTAAHHFASMATDVDRSCDGVLALRYLARHYYEDRDTLYRIETLAGLADCAPQLGRGSGDLSLRDPVAIAVGGVRANAIVDPAMPYVAVSSELGLDVTNAREVQIVLGEDLRDARLVRGTVTAGELAADAVDLAVFTAKDGDPQAVIGQGFLWRWDIVFTGPALVLTPIDAIESIGEVVDYKTVD